MTVFSIAVFTRGNLFPEVSASSGFVLSQSERESSFKRLFVEPTGLCILLSNLQLSLEPRYWKNRSIIMRGRGRGKDNASSWSGI